MKVIEAAKIVARTQLDAQLDAVAKGRGRATKPPPFANDEEAAAWRAALGAGELLAFLGLRERETELTAIHVEAEAPALRLVAKDGAPRSIHCAPASLDDDELLASLATRELVLSGDAQQLWATAELFERRGQTPKIAAVIVDHGPVLPAAAKLLRERLGAPVGEGLRDPAGGWLAIARGPGELLEPVRAQDAIYAAGANGDRLPPDQRGMLGAARYGESVLLPAIVCVRRKGPGLLGVELSVAPRPLGSRQMAKLGTVDLHHMFGVLPVFAYAVSFGVDEQRVEISLLPGVDAEQAEAEVRAAIAIGVERFELEFVAPGREFAGERVRDSRGFGRSGVVVTWAGEPGTEARRAGWRASITAAGVGERRVELRDASSGEAYLNEADGVAEVVAGLGSDRAGLPDLFGLADTDWPIFVGRPSAEASAEPRNENAGWITLLEGDDTREPMFVAGLDAGHVRRVAALFESGEASPELERVNLDGISLRASTRPMLGRGRASVEDQRPLWLDESRCVGAADCARICPTGAIAMAGEPARPQIDPEACIRCLLCAERCEAQAWRPFATKDGIPGRTLLADVPAFVATRARARSHDLHAKLTEPPARLDTRAKAKAPVAISRKPTVVLGLATVTLMEHAAALLVDGVLVGAVEEERLARERHYSWKHPTRPGTSLGGDPSLRIEESWPTRSIEAVLRSAGLTMDDVDLVAINGIPARHCDSFGGGRDWRAPPVLRANSIVCVPHHMAHAASAYGLSDFDAAWILSVDGRGDYETATIWRAEGHTLEIVDAVPWEPDCSFGGVYETVTRVLGFGTHGQGSTMALAALGQPSLDLSDCLGLDGDGRPVLSEWIATRRLQQYERPRDAPMLAIHHDLAASAQQALEQTVAGYLERHVGASLAGHKLALCGGVALNCRMNGYLRDRFAPDDMFVTPGANDAGTAIGAALVGHRELTGELPRLDLGHSHLGPAWSDDAIAKALQRMRVPFQRMRDVGAQTAELIAAGKIVCWFQGRMEFGPRALGGRSILADPRRDDLKPRLNAMKGRQPWRPFGSSVLAGEQGEWFVQDWDSRFMLFAVEVREDKRAQIPVVVHLDGSNRPQIVHAAHHPRYHALIAAFAERTGVPMIVNTSFNRGGEAIVCTPVEAMRSFVGLGADAIVLGDCLVRREMMRRR